jgi:formamidopyrimidine-DNA glycosylase
MPELPEVETVVRVLRETILNQTIEDAEVYWPKTIYENPDFKTQVMHQKIVNISRRGKYIIIHLESGYLIIHLRMEGRFYFQTTMQVPYKHSHVVFQLSEGQLEYNDTRKFGRIRFVKEEAEFNLSHLGLEPFDENLTPAYLKNYALNKKTCLKAFLLNQTTIVGIGNIYADEICFEAHLSPLIPIGQITLKQWKLFIISMRLILQKAIDNGGSTIRSYTSSLGISGRFQLTLKVYGRGNETCLDCQTPLKKVKISQRTTVYCPHCQRI